MERAKFTAPVNNYEQVNFSKKKIDKVALIDADRYKHLVTYRMWQKLMDEGEPHTTSMLNEIIDRYLSNDIFSLFEAKAYIFCFSAPSGLVFRNAIAQAKKYKGGRAKDDPYFYTNKYEDMAYVYEYINERYHTLFFEDLEADDILSMLQCENTFIFSHDKDLKQVPGWHWDILKYDLVIISEEEGFKNLLYQILQGDSTDNISGLQGFGEKALEKFKTDIDGPSIKAEHLVYHIMKLYTDRYGILKGFDTFVEMWSLVSLRLDRGAYNRDKYATAFYLIEKLCKDANNSGDIDSTNV
jgi:hypothetical protein